MILYQGRLVLSHPMRALTTSVLGLPIGCGPPTGRPPSRAFRRVCAAGTALLVFVALIAMAGCDRSETTRPKVIVVTPETAASAAGVQVPTVTVQIGSRGVSVSVGGENIGTRCNAKGPGVAVPVSAGQQQDFTALKECLETLKSEMPSLASQRSVVLVAAGTTPYATVIAAMDAMRSTAGGKDLFPDVVFNPAESDAPAPGAPRTPPPPNGQ